MARVDFRARPVRLGPGIVRAEASRASGLLSLAGGGFVPEWHWNFNTGTGWTDSAGRDTGKAIPLTLFNGGNGGVTIASAAGKNFPAGVNNAIQGDHVTGATFDWVGCQNLWAAPSVAGDKLFGRLYVRCEYPDGAGNQAYDANHTIESYGVDAGGFDFDTNGGYAVKVGNYTDGTFPLVFATYGPGTQYYFGYNVGTPASSATRPALSKNHTYRLEWGLTLTASANVYRPNLWLYNEAGTLLASGSDWKDNLNGGGVSLDPVGSNTLTTIGTTPIRGWRAGKNGGPTFGQTSLIYYSGVAFSRIQQCGAYTSAENT
ncbi:MAG TPA: hypothetical protein PK308_00160 [Phycisphaerales bacterium]|nr:hypothetical protein [Phycisphaerales bacterium]